MRRRGYQVAEAQDLTQSFFAAILEKERLRFADRHRGRFRSFLLSSMNHFILNQWRYDQATRRGGNCQMRSLDFAAGEASYLQIPSDQMTPDKVSERRWVARQSEWECP